MNKLKDITLFLSAFVPMFVLILLRLVIDMINHNLSLNILNTLNLLTLIFLIITGIVGLKWNISSTQSAKQILILSGKNITDEHFFGYFSLFVLFALQLDLSLISGYCCFVIIMIFIGIVYIKNTLYYINPLLNILGYNFYEINFIEKGSKNPQKAKMFYKGQFVLNKEYKIKIKNDNFTFIDFK